MNALDRHLTEGLAEIDADRAWAHWQRLDVTVEASGGTSARWCLEHGLRAAGAFGGCVLVQTGPAEQAYLLVPGDALLLVDGGAPDEDHDLPAAAVWLGELDRDVHAYLLPRGAT